MIDTTNLRYKDHYFESTEEYFQFMIEELGFPDILHFFDSQMVQSDGLKINVDVHTHHKDAPTIVFVPGTSVYGLCYAEILYELGKEGYNVVTLDPRGHGRSEGERGDYTIDELMADVETAIGFAKRQFNEKVTLMGSSQGGIVSFYLAARGIKVDSIICQNFADLQARETNQIARFPFLAQIGKPLLNGVATLLPRVKISTLSYLDLKSIKLTHFDNLFDFIVHDPFAITKISLRAAKSLANARMKKPVEEINIPTMVFQGTSDIIFPYSYTEKIYEKLNCKKRIHLYDDCDHAIMVENIDLIKPDILAWLDEIYPKN